MNVETSSQPIIGYRQWFWDRRQRRLVSPFRLVAWEPGITIAACSSRRRHDAPDPDCSCGLYADYRPNPLEFVERGVFLQGLSHLMDEAILEGLGISPDLVSRRFGELTKSVYGAIALEGRVCVHESGLRGERARIVVLAYGTGECDLVAEIAAVYDAEAVPFSELRQTALRFGVELSTRRDSPDLGLDGSPAQASDDLPTGPPWLWRHRPAEYTQRPYLACSVCGRVFMTHGSLRQHKLMCETARHGARVRW